MKRRLPSLSNSRIEVLCGKPQYICCIHFKHSGLIRSTLGILANANNASLNSLVYASMLVAVEQANIICCRLNCSIAIIFISLLVWKSRKITTVIKMIVAATISTSSLSGGRFLFKEKIFENTANPPLTGMFPGSVLFCTPIYFAAPVLLITST